MGTLRLAVVAFDAEQELGLRERVDHERRAFIVAHLPFRRHKIENMFGRLKDWRRIHTYYDRCAHAFMSVTCIAAAVIFWL